MDISHLSDFYLEDLTPEDVAYLKAFEFLRLDPKGFTSRSKSQTWKEYATSYRFVEGITSPEVLGLVDRLHGVVYRGVLIEHEFNWDLAAFMGYLQPDISDEDFAWWRSFRQPLDDGAKSRERWDEWFCGSDIGIASALVHHLDREQERAALEDVARAPKRDLDLRRSAL